MRSHGPLDQVTKVKMFCFLKWVNLIIILQPAQYFAVYLTVIWCQGCIKYVYCDLIWINFENSANYHLEMTAHF